MNRRGFLSTLLGAAVLDPEKLLWVPGQKLISIPSVTVCQPQVVHAQTAHALTFEIRASSIQQRLKEIESIPNPVSCRSWFNGRDYCATLIALAPYQGDY